jgi:hypothetical protein
MWGAPWLLDALLGDRSGIAMTFDAVARSGRPSFEAG